MSDSADDRTTDGVAPARGEDAPAGVEELLAEYLLAAEAGTAPDREAFIAQHPNLAGELRAFFEDEARVNRIAHPQNIAGGGGSEVGLLDAPTWAGPGAAVDASPAGAGDGATKVRYFGEYELLEEIGRGGMGVVYKARQARLNRLVALKMILAGQFASAEDVKRFQVEAENAAQLDHPNIVPIYEVGRHRGQHYFSMKLVEGGSLARQVAQLNKDHRAVARLVAVAARAVHHAHQRGILHRDIKPGNILIDHEGEPQITDFGLARAIDGVGASGLTLTGAVLGSPRYMAPEQAKAEKALTTAADVYGLGAVLYELLTGRPPFVADTALETLRLVREQEPARPSTFVARVNRDLETVCLKCLEKDRQQRYASALALAEDLERWLRDEPIAARPVTTPERLWRWSRRKPAAAALIGVSAAAAVTLITSLTINNARIRAEQHRTDLARQDAVQAMQIAQRREQQATDALRRESQALAREKRAGYFRTIALADREQSAGHLDLADQILEECPPELRDWEWRYLKRQCHRDLLTIRWNTGPVNFLAMSPDGSRLAAPNGGLGSHGKPCQVKVWDARTGQEIFTLKGHDGGVFTAVFSPDGRRLATAGNDGTLRVWDMVTGVEVCDLRHREGRKKAGPTGYQLLYASFSPDGTHLASAGHDGLVNVWDVEARTEVLSFPAHEAGVRYVYSVTYSPDGKTLLSSGGDGNVVLWDARTGAKVRVLQNGGKESYHAVFSRDGLRIATAHTDGTARIWDAATGKELTVFRGHRAPVNRLAFSPDGTRVASAAGQWDLSLSGEVKVWDATTGRELLELAGNERAALGVAYSLDGRWLATASMDGVIRVWDAAIGREPLILGGGGEGWQHGRPQIAFGPDRTRLTAILDRQLKSWDVIGGRATKPAGLATEPFLPGTEYRGLSGGGRFIVTTGRVLIVRETVTLKEIFSVSDGRPGDLSAGFKSASVSRDGARLATVAGEGSVTLYDARSTDKTKAWTAKVPGANRIDFSADESRLAVATFNGRITVLDARTGTEVWSREVGGGRDQHNVAFSADGRRLAVAGGDGIVRVLDTDTGELLLNLRGHGGSFSSVAFRHDGSRLVTGDEEGTVRVWEADTGLEVLALPGRGIAFAILDVAFSPDGWHLAAVTKEDVRIWDANPLAVPPRRPSPGPAPDRPQPPPCMASTLCQTGDNFAIK